MDEIESNSVGRSKREVRSTSVPHRTRELDQTGSKDRYSGHLARSRAPPMMHRRASNRCREGGGSSGRRRRWVRSERFRSARHSSRIYRSRRRVFRRADGFRRRMIYRSKGKVGDPPRGSSSSEIFEFRRARPGFEHRRERGRSARLAREHLFARFSSMKSFEREPRPQFFGAQSNRRPSL